MRIDHGRDVLPRRDASKRRRLEAATAPSARVCHRWSGRTSGPADDRIIAAITPCNGASDLIAHNLGPAIAGGNAAILKPFQLGPLSALRLMAVLNAAGLPQDVVVTASG